MFGSTKNVFKNSFFHLVKYGVPSINFTGLSDKSNSESVLLFPGKLEELDFNLQVLADFFVGLEGHQDVLVLLLLNLELLFEEVGVEGVQIVPDDSWLHSDIKIVHVVEFFDVEH